MAFTPTSTVYLLDTPLDNKYKNQIDFKHQSDQLDYFRSCRKHTFDNVVYVRKDNIIRVNAGIDELWDSNYVQYQNSNFSTKWFYAFITKMEYVNENATNIYIETDVFQTWMFETTLKPSFVVREHVSSDKVGEHLVEEGLELGEYKMDSYSPLNKMGAPWNILAVSDSTPFGDGNTTGNIYGNVVSGLAYYPFPNTESGAQWLKTVIDAYTSAGKIDAIVMIFTVPKMLIELFVDLPSFEVGMPLPSGYSFTYKTVNINKVIGNIDGYEPKNNKLISYPYKFLYFSNNNGQSAVFRYEDFKDYSMEFWLLGSVMPDPKIILEPYDYKGDGLKPEYGLTLSGYPLGSWSSDTYTAWFAQNAGSLALGAVGSLGTIAMGAMAYNPMAVIGGVAGVAGELAQIQKASIQPDQARGSVGTGSLKYSLDDLDFYYSHMSIKKEFAKIIDDFFTMYGYKVNALKVPETRSRYYWNYIKTIDVNIDGAIPTEDMDKLKSLYNSGITLWHDPAKFLNYNYDNQIGDLYVDYPRLLSATVSSTGMTIQLTFDDPMSDPTGKQSEFLLKVNNVVREITSISLDADTHVFNMFFANKISSGDNVTLSYTKGTVKSATNVYLESFANRSVNNGVPSEPFLMKASTSVGGTIVVLQFDKNMVDPAGKQSQFKVVAGGVQQTISSIKLDSESEKYILTMQTAIEGGIEVTTGYTRGTITSADGGVLQTYSDFVVDNNAIPTPPQFLSATTSADGTKITLNFDKLMADPTGKESEFSVMVFKPYHYQKWAGYGQSPYSSSVVPYQAVVRRASDGRIGLAMNSHPIFMDANGNVGGVKGDSLDQKIAYAWDGTVNGWGPDAYQGVQPSPTTQFTGMSAILKSNHITQTNSASTDMSPIATYKVPIQKATKNLQSITLEISQAPVKQGWIDFPDSPVLNTDYPYQAVVKTSDSSAIYLCVATAKLIADGTGLKSTGTGKRYSYVNGQWTGEVSVGANEYFATPCALAQFYEANYTVYTDSSYGTVFFTRTIARTHIAYDDVVLVTYQQGSVYSDFGGALASFYNKTVTNIVPQYQPWTTYPVSPRDTNGYPYQCIYKTDANAPSASNIFLVMTTTPLYVDSANKLIKGSSALRRYQWNGSTGWTLVDSATNPLNYYELLQTNADMFDSVDLKAVYFSKTT